MKGALATRISLTIKSFLFFFIRCQPFFKLILKNSILVSTSTKEYNVRQQEIHVCGCYGILLDEHFFLKLTYSQMTVQKNNTRNTFQPS